LIAASRVFSCTSKNNENLNGPQTLVMYLYKPK
jgi:hypothetical protein